MTDHKSLRVNGHLVEEFEFEDGVRVVLMNGLRVAQTFDECLRLCAGTMRRSMPFTYDEQDEKEVPERRAVTSIQK